MKVKYIGGKKKITISFPVGFQTRREIKSTVDFFPDIPQEIEEKDAKALTSIPESPFICIESSPEKKSAKKNRVQAASVVMNESFVEDFERRLGA